MNAPNIDLGEPNDTLPKIPGRAPETLALSLANGPEGEARRREFCRRKRAENAKALTMLIKQTRGRP